jgi:gas vesicle protein
MLKISQATLPRVDKHPMKRPKGDLLKGAAIGGIAASLVIVMFAPTTTNASAAVLLSPLASIGNQINQYLNTMTQWVDSWAPNLDGIIEDRDLREGADRTQAAKESVDEATRNSAKYHASGGGEYATSIDGQLSHVRNPETGRIDPERASQVLTPPAALSKDSVTSEDMERVWNHALMMTGDEPLKEVKSTRQDTIRGSEYEYKRIQTLQTRLLAQDAIQNYPLSGPTLQGYREHLEQMMDNSDIASLTPGQIAASQLEMSVNVEIPVAIDQLESSLRQERLLGAMLAQEIQDDVDDLLQSELAY